MRNDSEYCLHAKRELWRHLEGDILSEEIVATDVLLRKSLKEDLGPEDPEMPWTPLPLGPNEMTQGPVEENRLDDMHYLPLPTNRSMLNADGTPARKPTDAGLWLRHVRKILVIANKCDANDRASLASVIAALELQKIQTTHINSLDQVRQNVSFLLISF